MRIATWSALAAIALSSAVLAESVPFTGVNLAGGDFCDPKPGVPLTYGKNFVYPSQEEIDYFAGQGMNLFRIPFRWEILQPKANQPLAREEIDRYKAVVKLATDRKLIVLLDPHNYARYYGQVVGTPELPNAVFADFWSRMAEEFKDNPHVWFGLVNEPHDMPTRQWFDAAQAAITAIREAGAPNLILVPGNHWTGAHSWIGNNDANSNAANILTLRDPLNHWAIEVHQYLDKDSSGTRPEVANADIGVQRLKGFAQWCREHKLRAVLGEFAVANTPVGQAALENMLKSMEQDRDVWLGWTWWAAGPWWGDYMFTLEPGKGQDRPQMAWLKPFLSGTQVNLKDADVRVSEQK